MPFPLALLLESPSPVPSVPLTQETVLIRPPPRALGIKASQPGLTVASGAVTLSLWSWLCASLCPAGPRAVPLPGPGRGILFPHRWPVSAACSQGTCTTKRQEMFGWRLAGWHSRIRLGTATRLRAAPQDHCRGPQEQAGPHCRDLLQLCGHIAFSPFMLSASLLRKPHCCFPCHLCSF